MCENIHYVYNTADFLKCHTQENIVLKKLCIVILIVNVNV